MTPRPRCRSASVLVLLLLAVSGCGSGSDSSPSSAGSSAPSVPDVLDLCVGVSPGWRSVTGAPVPAAALGSGPTVVFANESGNSPCPWLEVTSRFVDAGFRVVLLTYADATAQGEAQAVRDTVAVAGAAADGGSFALVGASLGGRVVIEAAATAPEGLAAIVSLSGETRVENYRDITADARRVTLPALYVGAVRDPLTDGRTQQDTLHRAMRGRPNLIVQVPGAAHGTELLTTADGVVDRITRFLGEELR